MSKIQNRKPDPYLIVLTCAIFFVLFLTAYLMASIYTIISMAVAAGITFYQLLSARRPLSGKFEYGKQTPSAFSIFMVCLPIILATVVAYEGYSLWESPTRIIILWGLTMTFWSTMLFVPMAVYSKYKEIMQLDPTVYPSVSVIVPAYNEEKVIARTIEGLLETKYPKKEVIVVDDGSKDRTLEIANRYKDRVKVLHKENGGKATALNYGIAFAKGEIIVIVDADTIVGRDALKQIVKGFAIDKNVAAVAGNIKVRNRMNWLTWCQALEYVAGIQIVRRAFDFFGSITIVPGALGAFRKDALEQAGTYHKDTLVEDFDATIKILKSGFVISGSSEATAYTEAPQTMHDFINQRKRWYRGNAQVLSRHSDALLNPRYAFLYKIAYPFMIISMLVMPLAGLIVIINSLLSIILGDILFVIATFVLFIILQYLQSALAVRIDGDDPKLIAYSIFLVLGYKQIVDAILMKSAIDAALGRKATWTRAKRTGV